MEITSPSTRVIDTKQDTDAADLWSDFAPILVQELELSQPLPTFFAFDEKKEQTYRHLRCVVRLHTQLVGLVELQFSKDKLEPEAYIQEIWQAVNVRVNEHLQQDGWPTIVMLTVDGLPYYHVPPCIEERQLFLENAPFASIIISTHERPDTLELCLNSLLALDYPHYEIIVVDNAPSTTATFDLVQRLSQGISRLRYAREDLSGLSWARNKGIRLARGKILAFTDDDVAVDPYWLAHLVKGFSFSKNVHCVTGSILPLELDTPAQMLFEEFGGMFRGFDRRTFDLKENRPEWPSFPYTIWHCGAGASMAFTADFLQRVRGFDPALGGPGPVKNSQDMAIFFQVIARRHQLVYEPAALLYHLHRRDKVRLHKQIYSYGLGFAAYLTKSLLENPQFIVDFMVQLSRSFFSRFQLQRLKPQGETTKDFRELSLEWRKGAIYGPIAYFQTRRRVKQVLRKAGKAARNSYIGSTVTPDNSILEDTK